MIVADHVGQPILQCGHFKGRGRDGSGPAFNGDFDSDGTLHRFTGTVMKTVRARDRNGSAPWLLLNAMLAEFRGELVEGTTSVNR
jgi:hypothetical protein